MNKNKKEEIRVLILEDVKSDAELIKLTLRRYNNKIVSRVVSNSLEFKRALIEFDPQLVLCDYSLPSFSGSSALNIVTGEYPTIPVIMVTGNLKDEQAIEMIKAGAKDYVLKDNLFRLPSVIDRVMREREEVLSRITAEKAFANSELKFRRLFESSRDGIVVMDEDTGKIIDINPYLLDLIGAQSQECVGNSIERAIKFKDFNLVKKLFKELEGKEFAKSDVEILTRNSKEFLHMELVVNSYLVNGQKILQCNFRNITERKQNEIEVQSYVAKLEKAMIMTIHSLTVMTEMRDPYTVGHEVKVAHLASAIATEMKLNEDTIQGLNIAAHVHDIGKIWIPVEILSKPGRLMPIQFEMIKLHSQIGYEILKNVDFPWPIADIILQHHERIDGSGYPSGIKGDSILQEAKILGVADVVEAMASHRPYRAALGVDAALKEIIRGSGSVYDSTVVDACLRIFKEKQYVLPDKSDNILLSIRSSLF